MARIRTIKPEFWTDEEMAELSEPACLLAIGLLNYADDEGYFNANTKLIKAAVFPIREPSVPITVLVRELSNCGYLTLFSTADGKHFGLITNFAKHQVINKPKESKIRSLELIPYEYGTDTGGVPPGMDQGSGIREGNETPHNAREEIFKPDPKAANAIIDNRVPQSAGSMVDGKFKMFEGWQPDPDFMRKAALWGVKLDKPPTPEEIAEFVTYWNAEGKAFHQAQWEQKLARSADMYRTRKSGDKNHAESRPNTRDPNFRGYAAEAVHAANAELRRRYGIDDPESDALLVTDGRDVFGQVGSEKRCDTVITLDQSDWKAE